MNPHQNVNELEMNQQAKLQIVKELVMNPLYNLKELKMDPHQNVDELEHFMAKAMCYVQLCEITL